MKRTRRPLWLLLLLGVAPLQLGAKGCDTGVVGNDRPVCGGLAGNACAAGQFCEFPPDALCGAADATGVCKPIPELCTLEYAPVCGCDDVTYGNACEASQAGVSVARSGACEGGADGVCGGIAGLGCADGEFCNYAPDALCGAGDATGVCTAIPTSCTFEYAPVCGCDDKTYATACAAHAAGVSVARSGECEPSVHVCGGLGGTSCPDGEFCNFPVDASCGAADALGVCTPVPDACDAQFEPVCGCDDKTYGNACEANMAGVSVAGEGECEPSGGTTCGGLAGVPCAAGEFCNYAPDALCGTADATGVCAARPEACDTVYAPVCGCDGRTYGNACEANMAGVSVASEGECGSSGGATCGGFVGAACPAGEYCNYAGGELICGESDGTGVCAPIPAACTKESDPVCGCDGTTYGNPCMAAAAGVSVRMRGECP